MQQPRHERNRPGKRGSRTTNSDSTKRGKRLPGPTGRAPAKDPFDFFPPPSNAVATTSRCPSHPTQKQGPQEYAGRWLGIPIAAKIAKGLVVLLLLFLLLPANNLTIPHPFPPLLRKRRKRCRSLTSDEIPVWMFVLGNTIKRFFVHTAIALVFLTNLATPPHMNLTWLILLCTYIYTFAGYMYHPRNPPVGLSLSFLLIPTQPHRPLCSSAQSSVSLLSLPHPAGCTNPNGHYFEY